MGIFAILLTIFSNGWWTIRLDVQYHHRHDDEDVVDPLVLLEIECNNDNDEDHDVDNPYLSTTIATTTTTQTQTNSEREDTDIRSIMSRM